MTGKVSPHEKEVKTQSNLTRRGSSCILLQVKLLPLIGISRRSKSQIRLLNMAILVGSPPNLLLSS